MSTNELLPFWRVTKKFRAYQGTLPHFESDKNLVRLEHFYAQIVFEYFWNVQQAPFHIYKVPYASAKILSVFFRAANARTNWDRDQGKNITCLYVAIHLRA